MRFPPAVFQFALTLFLLHGGPANAQGFTGPKVADAKPGDLRVIATAAIREPLDAVLAQAQQVVGHRLVVEYGSARGNLRDTILAGQDFEVALLLPDVNEELLRSSVAVTASLSTSAPSPPAASDAQQRQFASESGSAGVRSHAPVNAS